MQIDTQVAGNGNVKVVKVQAETLREGMSVIVGIIATTHLDFGMKNQMYDKKKRKVEVDDEIESTQLKDLMQHF